jgi:hypothetical protein
MFALFSAVFGFAAPFLPQVLQHFQRGQDNAHELAMLELQGRLAMQQAAAKLAEIGAQADIAEMQGLRTPQESFGVQLLDAAKGWPKGQVIVAFYLFVVLDFLSGMVRPSVTYAMVAFYMAVKLALYHQGASLPQLWMENDWAMLTLVLSYFFGARTAKAVFGGSASSARPV